MKLRATISLILACLATVLFVPTVAADPQGDAGGQPPVTVCVGSADPSKESRCATATLTWGQSDCTGEAPNRTCTKTYTLTLAVGGTCRPLSCTNALQFPTLLRGNASVNIIPAELEVTTHVMPQTSRLIYTPPPYPIESPQGFDVHVAGVVCIAQVDWTGAVQSPDCKTWSGIVHLPGSNPVNGNLAGFAEDMAGYAKSFLSWELVPVEVRVETPPLPPEIPPEVVELIREVAGGGTVRIKVTASDFLDERMADESNRRLTP